MTTKKNHHGDGGQQNVPAGSLVARLAEARAARQRAAATGDPDPTDQVFMSDLARLSEAWRQAPPTGEDEESEPHIAAAPGEDAAEDASPAAPVALAVAAPDVHEPTIAAEPQESDAITGAPAAATEAAIAADATPEAAITADVAPPGPPPAAAPAGPPTTKIPALSNVVTVVEGLARARAEIEHLQEQAEQAQRELEQARRGCRAPDEVEQAQGAPQTHEELEQVRASARQLQAELDRTRLELHGVRRRSEQDKAEIRRAATGDVVMQIIPLLDDLDRALSHVPDGLRDDPWAAGVLMIGQGMRAMLAQQGAERIEPQGQPFDPHRHEAIAQMADDAVAEDTVVHVYRPGYALHGRVLRPAQVQVAMRKDH